METVKEISSDSGLDDSTDRGKHGMRCQSNREFEDMALSMSLLSLEAKEERALGMRWMGRRCCGTNQGVWQPVFCIFSCRKGKMIVHIVSIESLAFSLSLLG